jgi:hypothetical protein
VYLLTVEVSTDLRQTRGGGQHRVAVLLPQPSGAWFWKSLSAQPTSLSNPFLNPEPRTLTSNLYTLTTAPSPAERRIASTIR